MDGSAAELYADLKKLAMRGAAFVDRVYSSATRRRFDSPSEFLHFCRAGDIEPGQEVQVACKPSPFGAYLRNHFLSPVIGMNTQDRRGPPIVSDNPVLGLLAQTFSHLTPVGLAPVIEPGIVQATLYPADATAVGFVSILPAARDLVVSIPALVNADVAHYFGRPVVISGRAEFVDSAVLVEAGFLPEEYEALRQAGRVWFLDSTEECELTEIPIEGESELWGALYGQGHLEMDKPLPVDVVVAALRDAMATEGFEAKIVENKAEATRDFGLYAEGFRARVSIRAPVYSLHMDVELSREFASSRATFDRVTAQALQSIQRNASAVDVTIGNPGDLDFTYTDSTDLYSVLRSTAAEQLADPLAMTIRDWHRLRGK